MDLQTALAAHATPEVRAAGERLRASRRITVMQPQANRLTAVARDSLDHAWIRVSGARCDFGCSCADFAGDRLCAHLWAIALKASEGGIAFGAHSEEDAGVLEVLEDGDDLVDDFDDDYFENDSDGSFLIGPGYTPGPPVWKQTLDRITRTSRTSRACPRWRSVPERGVEIQYVLDLDELEGDLELGIEVRQRVMHKSGTWGPWCELYLGRSSPSHATREDLDVLTWLAHENAYVSHKRYQMPKQERAAILLTRLCATGRCFARRDGVASTTPLSLDDGSAWQLGLAVERMPEDESCVLRPFLERDGTRLRIEAFDILLDCGWLIRDDTCARFDARGAWAWLAELNDRSELTVPLEAEGSLIQALLDTAGSPLLELPERTVEVMQVTPRIEIRTSDACPRGQLTCTVFFDYGGRRIRASEPSGFLNGDAVLVPRDPAAEYRSFSELVSCGAVQSDQAASHDATIAAKSLPQVVTHLLDLGWVVEAEGARYRQAGAFRVSVTSGMDWFDLEGSIDFDGEVASLPDLLKAARKKERMVRLGDGTLGLLPESWLASWGLADAVAKRDGDRLRFAGNQAWLLDALLSAQEQEVFVGLDERFEEARARLRSFAGIQPQHEPSGFRGELRGYQREALGWLAFLRELRLGGCLADDMGLGKTVQVLAMLEARRSLKRRLPSLVVAPRSVVFNWIDEARRFTPALRVVDYTGTGRSLEDLDSADVLVTTYGTLRRDIDALRAVDFDYVILDEAQAIKNASSLSAKCARLLRTEHRLALSGTPIENHLGELWSLFEFLNPGMLGKAQTFQKLVSDGGGVDDKGRDRLRSALRPFFLRRTKQQVVTDLPEKSEQMLFCELDKAQRRDYDAVRDHMRASVLGRIADEGLSQSKLHVLEGLLRLRQAACHPGLIDTSRRGEPSAKLETLLPHLEEIAERGHKALVFSQFTTFLSIVRERLDGLGIGYAYLDGQTRDRAACVSHFQTDPACSVFLISLKAGGTGLNLTAADYVFLLDPWWNPAVEQQAIDRTHRIGQTRKVLAYRVVARDTVEEKVLALQAQKRELAEAVLGESGASLRELTREDLETLFG